MKNPFSVIMRVDERKHAPTKKWYTGVNQGS